MNIPQGSTTGAGNFPHYRAGYPPRPTVANLTPINNTGRNPTSIPADILVQLPMQMQMGHRVHQHPGPASYGTPAPPLTRPSGAQAPFHHPGVQSYAGQVNNSHQGHRLNQHHGSASYGTPAPPLQVTRPGNAQVPFHHPCVQLHAGHVHNSHRGAAGGYSSLGHGTPANFTHDARQPVNSPAARTTHTGQPHAVIHGHFAITHANHGPQPPCRPPATFQPAQTTIPNAHSHPRPALQIGTHTHQPNWQPAASPQESRPALQIGTHTHQPNWQPAASPQESPPPYTESAISPSTESVQSRSSFGNAPPPTPTLPLKEKRQREPSPSTDTSCPFPGCKSKNPGRKQELERHVGQHLPNSLFCTQPNCHWTGDRNYALANHYKAKHQGISFVKSDEFKIYDAKVLVKQLLNKEITMEQAASEAQTAFRRRGAELGKLGFWRE